MKQERTLWLVKTVEKTGMRFWELRDTDPELSDGENSLKLRVRENGELEFPFCRDTTNREMQLNCMTNKTGKRVTICVAQTLKKVSVPCEGLFYFVSCQGGFVQTFRMVSCSDHRVLIRTGRHYCELEEECCSYHEEKYDPISDGYHRLLYQGGIRSAGMKYSRSWEGNPMVYLLDNVIIDSMGFFFGDERILCH